MSKIKVCTKCKKRKKLKDFYKDKQKKDGLSCACKVCLRKISIKYARNNKEKIKKYRTKYNEKNRKNLLKWQKEYEKEHKEERSIYHKKHYNKNRVKLLKEHNKYNEENKESIAQQKKEYREKNKRKISERQKNYQRERRNSDIAYKILNNLRTRLWHALKGKSKSKRTMELLGCSVEFLKKHLESQFKPGMNWKNYGRKKGIKCWEVDHIKPCSKFDLSKPEEQHKCFHYANLQPLWFKNNSRKGGKYQDSN